MGSPKWKNNLRRRNPKRSNPKRRNLRRKRNLQRSLQKRRKVRDCGPVWVVLSHGGMWRCGRAHAWAGIGTDSGTEANMRRVARVLLAAVVLVAVRGMAEDLLEDLDAYKAKITLSDLKEKEIELARREEALQALEKSLVGRANDSPDSQKVERDSDCSKVIQDLKAVEERNLYLESRLQEMQEANFALIHEKHSRDEMDRRAKLRDGYQPQVSSTTRKNDKWDTYPTGPGWRLEL